MRTRMLVGALVLALVLALVGAVVAPAHAEGNLQPAAAAGWFYHTVKAGETVSSIALHYGVTQQAIINLNGLAWPYTIYSGKWLKIPTYTNYPPMPSYRYHIVKWGETVNSIGRWYGVTAQSIINLNGLRAPYTIYAGQSLYIPAWGAPGPHPGPVGRAYVVRSGDTLIRIGQWYGVPWGDIAWHNHLGYPYNIYVGQVLYIP